MSVQYAGLPRFGNQYPARFGRHGIAAAAGLPFRFVPGVRRRNRAWEEAHSCSLYLTPLPSLKRRSDTTRVGVPDHRSNAHNAIMSFGNTPAFLQMLTHAKPMIRIAWPPNAIRWRTRQGFLLGLFSCGLVLLGWASAVSASDEGGQNPSFTRIDREVQAIKQEMLDINRDLALLEAELLYPAEHRLTVFLSLGSNTTMDIDALEIDLNGESLVYHRYSDAEMEALRKGGVHKAYIGSIEKGEHVLRAQLSGTGRRDQVFDIVNSARFTKLQGTRYVELLVSESTLRGVPHLTIQSW
jgi:hypothetical protein